MKNILRTSLLTLLIFALSCASGGGTTGTGGFDFTGKVLFSNGDAITGLEVNIESPGGELLGTTSTTTDGTFAFNGLATSDSVVKVKKPDGQVQEFVVSIPAGSNKANLTLRQKPDGKFSRDDKFEERPKGNNGVDRSSSSQANTNSMGGKGSSSSISSGPSSESSDDESSSDGESTSSERSGRDDKTDEERSSESSSSSSASEDDDEEDNSSESSSGGGKGRK
jgi:hypothetical protein